MDPLIGQIIDKRYRVVRLIGEGGMGSVYEAEHVKINRRVAIKAMRPEVANVSEAVSRFVREAQAASAIGHPNIIEIHDIIETDEGMTYIVMELLKGQTLDALLNEQGRLAPERAINIILQVLSALIATHHKGIVHRDLKPENIFLSVDLRMHEEVKLLDFGASKVQGPEGDLKLTKTGTVLGTPFYLSPEQARGAIHLIDGRTDVWAAGVVLFEMISGRPPYQGTSYNELLGKILLDPIPSLGELVPELPAGLQPVVEKALAKDVEQRYRTAADMIEALLPFRSGDLALSPGAEKALKVSIAPPPVEGLRYTPPTSPASRLSLAEMALETTADARPRASGGVTDAGGIGTGLTTGELSPIRTLDVEPEPAEEPAPPAADERSVLPVVGDTVPRDPSTRVRHDGLLDTAESAPLPTLHPSSSPRRLAVAAALLVAVGVLLWFTVFSSSGPDERAPTTDPVATPGADGPAPVEEPTASDTGSETASDTATDTVQGFGPATAPPATLAPAKPAAPRVVPVKPGFKPKPKKKGDVPLATNPFG